MVVTQPLTQVSFEVAERLLGILSRFDLLEYVSPSDIHFLESLKGSVLPKNSILSEPSGEPESLGTALPSETGSLSQRGGTYTGDGYESWPTQTEDHRFGCDSDRD